MINMLKSLPILAIAILLLILSLAGNVYFLLDRKGENDLLLKQISELQANRDRQKAEKDQIRRFWEEQANVNDNLINSQQQVLSAIQNYFEEITKSIRFVGGKPQLLPTVNEDNLRNSQNNLKKTMDDLEKEITKNSQIKQNITEQINTLYKNGGEGQNNRVNPRDGIRN